MKAAAMIFMCLTTYACTSTKPPIDVKLDLILNEIREMKADCYYEPKRPLKRRK